MKDGYDDAAAELRRAVKAFRPELRVRYRRTDWKTSRSHVFRTARGLDRWLERAAADETLVVLGVDERVSTRWTPSGDS